jgi:intein/homing endonuclease
MLFKQCYALEKIHGCLHSDSPINMADKSLKKLKDINRGDFVRSYDEKMKKFLNKEVNGVIIQDITEHLNWHKLTFDNGVEIICTEDHPILTTVGWVQAKDICDFHEIINEK